MKCHLVLDLKSFHFMELLFDLTIPRHLCLVKILNLSYLSNRVYYVQIDLYFGGADLSHILGSNSPRNELESLNLLLKNIDDSILNHQPKAINVLQELRNATVNLMHDFGKKVGEETRVVPGSNCEKENALLQWGKSNGISTKLEIACEYLTLISWCEVSIIS